MSHTEIRWIAHSWYQVEINGVTIHLDPSTLASNDFGALVEDTDKADIVLVTHHHADHCRKDIIGTISKKGALIFAPKACSAKLGRGMVAIKPGDEHVHCGISFKATHAYNTAEGSSTVKAHKKGECLGFLLSAGGRTIYHAGDTDLIPEMSAMGGIDVALLPIGGTYTMNVSEAAEAVRRIMPGIAVPMHFIDADPQAFAEQVGEDARVVILRPGETLRLD